MTCRNVTNQAEYDQAIADGLDTVAAVKVLRDAHVMSLWIAANHDNPVVRAIADEMAPTAGRLATVLEEEPPGATDLTTVVTDAELAAWLEGAS